MKRRKHILLLTALAAVMLFGCSSGGSEEPVLVEQPNVDEAEEIFEPQAAKDEAAQSETPDEDVQDTAPDTTEDMNEKTEERNFDELKAASEHFNYELLSTLSGEDNIFYSPYSLMSALALADVGATGETKEELEKALGIGDMSEFEKDLKAYMSKEVNENARLTTANGIWLNDTLLLADDFETGYKQDAIKYFNANVTKADFAGNAEGIKQEISGWVRENTEGFIPDYSPNCDKDTVMALINAVYFYGKWASPFSPDDTENDIFHGINGDSDISMMNKYDIHNRYIEDYNGISAAALPYRGEEIEMDILMGKDGSGADSILDLVKGLSEEELRDLFDSIDNAEYIRLKRLALPKFEMDKTFTSIEQALKDIGIEKAFSSRDEFDKIAHEIFISQVNHRAKLEVDEEGSRAAAVTEIGFSTTSLMEEPEREINFIVDRPFVFFIRDCSADNILFAGFVRDL